ncbi:hypothetical protein ACIA8E_32500 [Streptomyces sp. NPDC051664]|uniref:hypothetical protein n=1 Tax=Streptomyces sp. NPDC051664 TaxID=3365668 RepID=UPI0037895629
MNRTGHHQPQAPIADPQHDQVEKAQNDVALIAAKDPKPWLIRSREATTAQYKLVSDNFQCFDKGRVRYARDWLDVIEGNDDAQLTCSYDGVALRAQRLPVAAGSDRQCTWEQLWQAGAYSG